MNEPTSSLGTPQAALPVQVRRARVAAMMYFVVLGLVLGTWAVAIPSIKTRLNLSYSEIGVMLLIFGIASFGSMSAAGRLIERLGSRTVLIIGGTGLGVALILPGIATSPVTLALALIVVGLTNGLLDASQNSHGVEVERRYGRPIMNAFHAMFSVGGLIAATVGGIALSRDVSDALLLAAVGATCVVLSLTAAGHLLPNAPNAKSDTTPVRGRRRWPRRTLLLGVTAFALLLAEGAAYDWSNVFMRTELQSSAAQASAAFGAFSITMLFVRLVADRIVGSVGPAIYVRVSATVAAAGLTFVALSSTSALAVIGWAIFGLGAAGCVPQMFSAAGSVDPDQIGLNVSRVASVGYLGVIAGPSLVGFAANATNLRVAMIIPILCCLVAVLNAGLLRGRADTSINYPSAA